MTTTPSTPDQPASAAREPGADQERGEYLPCSAECNGCPTCDPGLAPVSDGQDGEGVVCVCSPFIRAPWCQAEHDVKGCGAEPPHSSWIPCMIVARPHAEHWSWSGCAGGHLTWTDAAGGIGQLTEALCDAIDAIKDEARPLNDDWPQALNKAKRAVRRFMSEPLSAPTPAVVPQGEALGDDERAAIRVAMSHSSSACELWDCVTCGQTFAAVETIVAARVRAAQQEALREAASEVDEVERIGSLRAMDCNDWEKARWLASPLNTLQPDMETGERPRPVISDWLRARADALRPTDGGGTNG